MAGSVEDLWNGAGIAPKSGTRIIATYNDGSGAKLFAVVEYGDDSLRLIDQDGDEYDVDHLTGCISFDAWAYLPKGSKLWCELTSDEPIKLEF